MSLLRRLSAVLPVLALVLPAAASAQGRYVPERRPPVLQVVVTGDDACPGKRADDLLVCGMLAMGPTQLRILRYVSRCLVQRRPAAARSVLADGYDAADRPALRKIVGAGLECGVGGQLNVSGLLFAGAMAESMLASMPHHGHLDRLVGLDPTRPSVAAHDEPEMMSLCAVRAAPRAAATFFATEGGSKAEEAAVRALLPQLTDCLGRDVRLVTNRPALRALLALAALRLALNNQRPAAAAETHG